MVLKPKLEEKEMGKARKDSRNTFIIHMNTRAAEFKKMTVDRVVHAHEIVSFLDSSLVC